MTVYSAMKTLAAALLCALLTGCAAPVPSLVLSASPTASSRQATPTDSLPLPSPLMSSPAGLLVPFDSAALLDGNRVLTLQFVGGRLYSASDPCSRAYAGWAQPDGDVLDAAVVDVTPPPPGGPIACTAEGHDRTVSIPLAQPYLGSRVRDRAGDLHFVRQPAGLVELHGLPAGWLLRSEGDVEGSPSGRWLRTYSPLAQPNIATSKNKLDLYQAFGGPADVSGGDTEQAVSVNGQNATLYRSTTDGELVLDWMLGTNGLALDANEADFSVAQLIRLAESATGG